MVENVTDDPNSVDNMVSASVLEWFLGTVNAKIEKYEAAGKEPPEELMDQQSDAEFKQTMLQTQVCVCVFGVCSARAL